MGNMRSIEDRLKELDETQGLYEKNALLEADPELKNAAFVRDKQRIAELNRGTPGDTSGG